jgi:chromosome partitioning protein
MHSILVASVKGGCGRTTIATNIAAARANDGLRTGFAELERQRSAADWLTSRSSGLAGIEALDWRRDIGAVRGRLERLVIDLPAAMRIGSRCCWTLPASCWCRFCHRPSSKPALAA